jgi:hypothetical protein
MNDAWDAARSRKEMTRALKRIDAYVAKNMSKFPDAKYVVAVNHVTEYKHSVATRWSFLGDPVLRQKLTEWTPALDTCLCMFGGDDDEDPIRTTNWLDMPSTAEKRAEKTRKGLRLVWLEHVYGTPYEGKKQMFDLVKKGVCRKFEWWDRVTDHAPFESKSLDDPRISMKVYAYIASVLHAMSIS